jgi:hypothetical protein
MGYVECDMNESDYWRGLLILIFYALLTVGCLAITYALIKM